MKGTNWISTINNCDAKEEFDKAMKYCMFAIGQEE